MTMVMYPVGIWSIVRAGFYTHIYSVRVLKVVARQCDKYQHNMGLLKYGLRSGHSISCLECMTSGVDNDYGFLILKAISSFIYAPLNNRITEI